jgi:hypothetical protein
VLELYPHSCTGGVWPFVTGKVSVYRQNGRSKRPSSKISQVRVRPFTGSRRRSRPTRPGGYLCPG